MYGLPENLIRLSPAEEQVMLAVWASTPPVTRAEVARHLPRQESGAPWADSTLLNFLYRLENKNWLKSGKDLNRNMYIPTTTRRAYGVAVMRERMDTIFSGSLPDAVAALVSESGASQSQLEKARAVLEEKIAAAEEYDLYDPYG